MFFISGMLSNVRDIWMSEKHRLNNSVISFKTIYTHISQWVWRWGGDWERCLPTQWPWLTPGG